MASDRARLFSLGAALLALPWLMASTVLAAPGQHGAPHQPGHAHSDPQPHAQACAQISPQAAVPASMPALAASFRVTFTGPGQAPRQQVWRLQRSSTELVWDRADAQTDIWRRDAGGIRLDRVLHSEQAVVSYSAGELRTLELAIDWQALGRLLSNADLAQLRRVSAGGGPGQQQGLHCKGRLSGDQVELLWDPQQQLPLRLLRRNPRGQVLIERTAWHLSAPASWRTADAAMAGYRQIDAADFGDLANDPAARRAQAQDQQLGWRGIGHH